MLKIFKKPISSFILVCILLFLIILLYGVYSNKPITAIREFYPQTILSQHKEGELLKGDRIAGEFRATADNLGIVSIRFQTFSKVNEGMFVFRIKERGKNEWIYSSEYMAEKFGGYTFFPFGFPVVNNSNGKYYYFELESLNSALGKTVAISKEEPIIQATYKFTINQLLSDKKILYLFIFNKIKNILGQEQIIRMFVLVYSLLAFLYIVFNTRKKFFQFYDDLSKKLSLDKKKSIKFTYNLELKKKMTVFKKIILWLCLSAWFIIKIFFLAVRITLKPLTIFNKWLTTE